MARASVKKLSLVGLQNEKKEMTKLLHKLGCIQIESIQEQDQEETGDKLSLGADEERNRYQSLLNDADFCLNFLDRYERYKKGLFDVNPSYTEDEMERKINDLDTLRLMGEIRDLDSELNSLKAEENKINSNIESLKPWISLDIPLSSVGRTRYSITLLGSVLTPQFQALQESLAAASAPLILEKVLEERDLTYFTMIMHRSAEAEAMDILKNYSFLKADIHGARLSAKQEIDGYENRLQEIASRREVIKQAAIGMMKYRGEIQVISDYAKVLLDRNDQYFKFLSTNHTFILTGYVDALDTDRVEKAVAKLTPYYYMFVEEPAEDDDVPTLVHNNKVVTPFETVTNLYSPPSKNDLDPNPWITPFFIIFFGMMLSDAGYGLILTVACAFVVWKMKPEGTMGNIIKMMIYCGISTMFWGFMFGGFFGDLFYLKPLWINPSEDPMTLLIVSFGFGVIHIFTGLIAMMVKNIKAGDVKAAIFDQLSWMVLITSLLLIFLPATKTVGIVLVIASALLLVLTQGRAKKNIIGKLVGGVGSLYNITSYLSDILSYARLLALGLATGIIANVVNTLGRLLGGSAVGFIFMVVVLIFGHTFNMAINLLGTYVHTSRLQYVEFFGKFYEGGGRLFTPFKIKTKFIKYQESEDF